LATRLRAGEQTIAFDKDDPDALDFVTAAANLRSFAYGIPLKSKWEVKEMAGNIIPAIATTNAIIAGMIVLQALHLLRNEAGKLRTVCTQFNPTKPFGVIMPSKPNEACGSCRDTFAVLQCDPERATLGEVITAALGTGEEGDGGTGEREILVFEGARMLAEPDWDDNLDTPLSKLGVDRGKFLSVVDEDGGYGVLALAIAALPYVRCKFDQLCR
jgi:ubiquitin-like 1-activating enzyme E1 B